MQRARKLRTAPLEAEQGNGVVFDYEEMANRCFVGGTREERVRSEGKEPGGHTVPCLFECSGLLSSRCDPRDTIPPWLFLEA